MRPRFLLQKLCVISAALALSAQCSWAAPIFAITQDANAGLGGPGDIYTVGYEVVIGSQPLTITSLGMWDGDATDGFTTSHDIGIWTTTGTLLGSVTVPAGTASAKFGDYRYVALSSPVTLAAGTHYIAAPVGGDVYHSSVFDNFGPTNDFNDPDWPVFGTPDVNFAQRWGVAGAGLNFPNDLSDPNFTSSAWDAPNFTNVPLPEPASIGMLTLAGLTLLRRSR